MLQDKLCLNDKEDFFKQSCLTIWKPPQLFGDGAFCHSIQVQPRQVVGRSASHVQLYVAWVEDHISSSDWKNKQALKMASTFYMFTPIPGMGQTDQTMHIETDVRSDWIQTFWTKLFALIKATLIKRSEWDYIL